VFVIGDAALVEDSNGKGYPMVAPVATQQAVCAAENIQHLAAGEACVPFRYHDLGTMATIGRNQAVAMVNGLQFRGFLAWMVWLVVHILQLIGFRNRLVVLINWAWDYFFYDRAVRLIQQSCGEDCLES
jgi:NADH dehydrogenase